MSAIRSIRTGVLAVALTTASGTVEAQGVGSYRFDPASNSYFVTIATASGLREIQVFPANGARGEVHPVVTSLGNGAWRYAYTIALTPTGTQNLSEVEVPCAQAFAPRDLGGTAYGAGKRTAPLVVSVRNYPTRDVCIGGRGFLRAGDSLTFSVTANAAPAIGSLHLIGSVKGPVWPEEAGGSNNARAEAVADSIGGITGGWYEVLTAAPIRPASALATPNQIAHAMQSDLATACGRLGLISPAGICNSLTQKLGKAVEAVEQGRPNANNLLSAFLLELDAQRGQHVPDSAYAVLHALALLLQSQLAR